MSFRTEISIGLTFARGCSRCSLLRHAGRSAQAAMPLVAGSSLDAVQKAGVLRICTPGDYKPFSFQKTDGTFEGIDVDLMTSLQRQPGGAKPEWIKTSWANLLPDLAAGKCDMAVGGISVTTDRQKRAFFSAPYMVNGKTPIARCADVAKYQSVADIDKPSTRVIFNPGGSNERFARANFKQAQLRLHPEN
jgi:cyclohexadienyl dehydratase